MNITYLRRRVIGALAITSVTFATVLTAGPTAASAAPAGAATTTTTAVPAPPTTLGPTYYIRSLVSGWDHTCALRGDGTVACWGGANQGQLGTGTLTAQSSAVTLPNLRRVSELAAGAQTTCALTWDREVYCWGRNDRGQVGDGTGARRTTPVKVPISGATLLAVGNSHACAATDSALYCWGANESGQLGTNDTVDRLSPTVVGVGVPFVALGAFNSSTCGQTSFGHTACTGSNLGMFGNGSVNGSKSFTTVPALTANYDRTVIDGATHRCHAERESGKVRCVGSNGNGGLGDGTNLTRTSVVTPPGVFSTATAGFTNLSCGFEKVLRQYQCWGSNGQGQVGDGTTTNRATPVPVKGLPAINQTYGSVSAGRYHACATYDPGAYSPDRVYCWGSDSSEQLGNGTGGSSTTAVLVKGV